MSKTKRWTINKRIMCGMTAALLSAAVPAGCSEKQPENTIVSEGAEEVLKAAKVEQKELTPDSTIVSVGDEKASYKELMVYRYILKDKYQDTLGEGIWNYEIEPGKTLGSMTTAQVVSMIAQMKIIGNEAKELGISLSGDEIENIRQYAASILQTIPEQDVQNYMLDLETMTNVYCENEIADRVYDSCINGVSTSITDDDSRQCTVWYIYLQTSGINQSGVQVNLTEEEVKGRYKEAKKLRKKAKDVTDFYSFAQANTESDNAELTFGRGDMSDEFTNAAFVLNEGELSPIIQTPEGFYLIYMVDANNEELATAKKEELVAAAQKANFEQMYSEWAAQYEIQISDLIL